MLPVESHRSSSLITKKFTDYQFYRSEDVGKSRFAGYSGFAQNLPA